MSENLSQLALAPIALVNGPVGKGKSASAMPVAAGPCFSGAVAQYDAAPLIRWAGSKRKLLPILLRRVPEQFKRYIEPFAGSACLFFALQPRAAILSDHNPTLIEAYRTITKHPVRVLNLARSFPATAEAYYSVRDHLLEAASPVIRAARFLYLNRYCFNALYRTDKKGRFNVPFGSRTGAFLPEPVFRRSAALLGRATLICSDFESTISRAHHGDFVYLDPPYATSKRIDRTEYGPNSFTVSDIPRLVRSLGELHSRGARFLLSYCACPDLLRMLPSRAPPRVRVRRHIAATASRRRVVSELLVDNADVFGEYP